MPGGVTREAIVGITVIPWLMGVFWIALNSLVEPSLALTLIPWGLGYFCLLCWRR